MTRALTSAMGTAIAADKVYPVVFVEISFASGIVRFWSGLGPITWNGLTWYGTGALGSMSQLPETSDLQAQGVSLSLSGIPSDILADCLGEVRQGKPARIWFGAMDASGGLIADPYQAMAGRVDAVKLSEGGDTSTITVNVETQLVDMQRARDRRYTDKDQQFYFPGDLGFQYVPAMQTWTGVWGRKTTSASSGGGGGGNGGGGSKNPRFAA